MLIGGIRLRAGRIVPILLAVLLGSPFLISAEQGFGQSANQPGNACFGIFAPAYYWYDENFFPQWEEVINSGSEDMIVTVVLPTPEQSHHHADPAYAWVMEQARARGIKILAYVQTYFGERDLEEIYQIIATAHDWYNLDGIFIDEVMPDSARVDYYASIVKNARQYPNKMVITNPGGVASKEYVEMVDKIVLFEGTYAQYQEFTVPEWIYDYPADQFIHLIHSTSGDTMDDILDLAAQRNASMIYITDDRPANAYHLLPTYWDEELAKVRAGC